MSRLCSRQRCVLLSSLEVVTLRGKAKATGMYIVPFCLIFSLQRRAKAPARRVLVVIIYLIAGEVRCGAYVVFREGSSEDGLCVMSVSRHRNCFSTWLLLFVIPLSELRFVFAWLSAFQLCKAISLVDTVVVYYTSDLLYV